MQENRYASSVAGQSVSIDAGLRSYMLGVYNHMTTALALTGFAAFGTKLMVQANPAFGQLLFGTPLMYVIMFAPLAMVMWISFRINSMSPAKARTLFYIYATVMGLSLSTILFRLYRRQRGQGLFHHRRCVCRPVFVRLYNKARSDRAWRLSDCWCGGAYPGLYRQYLPRLIRT